MPAVLEVEAARRQNLGTAMNPGGIIVGLNGSHASRAALQWAIAEAVIRGRRVAVLTVLTSDRDDCRQIDRMQAHLIRAASAGLLDHTSIDRRCVRGRVGPALVEASEGAAALVIGRHQARITPDTATGIIIEYCLQASGCPVVIVPNRDPAPDRDALAPEHQRHSTP